MTARRDEKTSEPGVYRRGSRYVVIYRDRQGRQHRKAAGSTLREARDVKAATRAAVASGERQDGRGRVTFARYAEQWLTSYQGRNNGGIRSSTRREYRRAIEQRAVPFFGRMRLDEIGPLDVKKYLADVAASGASYDTTRLALAPVRALFATAVEDELVRVNPCAGIRVPRAATIDDDEESGPKAMTRDELRGFLAAVPDEWRLLFELLAHTGLRVSEALALRWDDVDLGQRELRVRRRLYEGKIGPPKSKFGKRTIPLSPGVSQALWRARGGASGDEPVFPGNAAGGYLSPSTVFRNVLKPAARSAGVPWAGFHTLRHTCATLLFDHGANAKQVQAWLGHHSPAFTLAVYVHAMRDNMPDPGFLDDLTAGG